MKKKALLTNERGNMSVGGVDGVGGILSATIL